MAVDKLVDSTQLDTDLTSVANAIRTKGGTSASLAFPAGFVSAIAAIPSGGSSVESGTYTPATRTMSHSITTQTEKSNFVVVAGDGFTFSLGTAAMVMGFYNHYCVGTNNSGSTFGTVSNTQGSVSKSGNTFTYTAGGTLSSTSRCWQAGVTYTWFAW